MRLSSCISECQVVTVLQSRFAVHIQARHSTEDEYCLPQSLATILEYWKLPNDVLEIGSVSGDDRYLGKALRYLDARAEEVRYKRFSPTVACIKALIDAGYPVLLVG